jgi:hypothetical protein
MKVKATLLSFLLLGLGLTNAQSTRFLKNTTLPILKGNYAVSNYQSSNPVQAYDQIACEVNKLVSRDSLQLYVQVMEAFGTRHTFSDTASNNFGIGAFRRWAYQKLENISQRNENRLQVDYLSFNLVDNCGTLNDTRNVVAVLPGNDSSSNEAVLLMAHMDSRCAAPCDSTCLAPGADDNGSGSALVLELARVLSRFTFDHSLVFMLTTGEEQGLHGARAFADYMASENVPLKAVLNNDIVGGTICGATASPPGCSPAGAVDSTRIRIYTNPLSDRNPNQAYARSIKLLYQEKMAGNFQVPMTLELVNQEDRSGRGGDHIAFRENDYRNVRFTSAHEHGNGNPLGTPNYTDHQHTSNDIIGEDFNSDGTIDSFYVDFNYLARNAIINGTTANFLANGPDIPNFILHNEPSGLRIEITDANLAAEYRVGIKTRMGVEFDSLYRFSGNSFVIPGQQQGTNYYVGVAALNASGLMSPFNGDERAVSQTNTPAGTTDILPYGIDCTQIGLDELALQKSTAGLVVLPPRPNPSYGTTDLVVLVHKNTWQGKHHLKIVNNAGKVVFKQAMRLERGANTLRFVKPMPAGLYFYFIEGAGGGSLSQKMWVQ